MCVREEIQKHRTIVRVTSNVNGHLEALSAVSRCPPRSFTSMMLAFSCRSDSCATPHPKTDTCIPEAALVQRQECCHLLRFSGPRHVSESRTVFPFFAVKRRPQPESVTRSVSPIARRRDTSPEIASSARRRDDEGRAAMRRWTFKTGRGSAHNWPWRGNAAADQPLTVRDVCSPLLSFFPYCRC